MASSRPIVTSAPPSAAGNLAGWIKAHLFADVASGVLTVAILAALIAILPGLFRWAFTDAVWAADNPQACRDATGACWAVVESRFRLIIFGRFPYGEQWRPTIAMFVLIGTAVASCDRRFWRGWLVFVWIGAVLVFLALMRGGFLGLSLVPSDLWGGLPLTLMLAFVGIAAAFPLAILLALGRRSKLPAFKYLSIGYIELIRGVPLISVLFMASFLLPLFMPTGVSIDAVLRAQVAIILFTAAYLAEVVRGGLQAMPKGQFEAADALALGYWRTHQLIILPQALKLSIPPIVNTFIGLFKDTSLVAIVSLSDLTLSARQALADPEWRQFFFEGYLFVAMIYWLFCFFMSKYSQYLERVLRTNVR